MAKSAARRNRVVIYSTNNSDISAQSSITHAAATRTKIAEKLAVLKRYEFAGEFDPTADYSDAKLYFVPTETLLHAHARQLGIDCEDHLFGGSVALPFIATKIITHPLVQADAIAPLGWTAGFAGSVADAVLVGYAAFSVTDARTAARKLLKHGAVRVKPALGIGGCGQIVATNMAELDAALASLHAAELTQCGVVLEQNLQEVVTYSIGRVRAADLSIAYYGTQQLTTNHNGEEVYGGSTLQVVRGDFNALRQLSLPSPLQLAVQQAQRYDSAADAHFSGLLASRRNYDVARGTDEHGQVHSGVLEQSWRIGGASPAEIEALEVLAGNPEVRSVQTSSHEIYDTAEPPPHATIYFRGVDARVGPLIKYSTTDSHEYFT